MPSTSDNIASLTEKVALITGASSGMGRAIATAYAAAGAYVVNADLTSSPPRVPIIAQKAGGEDLTTPTVDLINSSWPSARDGAERAVFVKCDVTNEESIKESVAFAVKTYGRLDIWVNNAGPGILAEQADKSFNGKPRRIHELEVSVIDRSHAVNVRGVWLGTRHAVTQFLAQEPHSDFGHSRLGAGTEVHRGWIINLASTLSSVGFVGSASYCASKGAVLQLTRTTALEYAPDGIHINAIQPSFTDTSLMEKTYSMGGNTGKEAVENWLKTVHPWGRPGRPEDIARVAVFLAGQGAGWITGHGLVVDGGYTIQ